MSLYSLYKTYQPVLSFLLIIFAPSHLPRLLRLWQRRQSPPPPTRPVPREPWSRLLWSALFLHTAYHALHLLYPPYHLFASNSLPLLAPNAQLRTAVTRSFTSAPQAAAIELAELHPALELLLQKLQSLDNRLAYFRFGHDAMLSGHWGEKWEDYALIALPGIMGAYLAEAAFLGLLGLPILGGSSARRRSQQWRQTFSWILVALAIGELGVRCLWDLRPVKGDCLNLATRLLVIRSVVFLLLPIAHLLLPLATKLQPASLVPALLNVQTAIRLSSLTRTAVTQDESLRSSWAQSGAIAELQAQTARDDVHVRREMDAYRVNEREIRQSARQWINDGFHALGPTS